MTADDRIHVSLEGPNAKRLRERLIVRWHADGHDALDRLGVPRFDESQSPLVEYTIAERIEMATSGDPICILWARMKDDRYPVQFVTAFPDGLVESWAEWYDERRAEAEREFRDFGDEDDVTEFFTTYHKLRRPEASPLPGGTP